MSEQIAGQLNSQGDAKPLPEKRDLVSTLSKRCRTACGQRVFLL